jgi:peptidyl-tRNA hydrolase, PTH1 family
MFAWIKKILKPNNIDSRERYLVLGLGNMGADYDNTRHNIGFEVLDQMAQQYGVHFKNETLGDMALIEADAYDIILLKPSTYMNRSGKALLHWGMKLNLSKERILVVVDDLNLKLGKLRLREKGSHGGHNGLRDIESRLGHNDYLRLRMGIGKEFAPGEQVDFVLGKWSDSERPLVSIMIKKAINAIENWSQRGVKTAQDQLHQ